MWGALLVTGIFASALGFLVQTWAQQRTSATRTALVFTLEPVWAALFGYTLAGDRLGAARWGGLRRDHGGNRRRRAGGRLGAAATRARLAARMTAVLLALASAAAFGAMTVAIRRGPRCGRRRDARNARDADDGTRDHVRLASLPRHDYAGAWKFFLAGLLAPGLSQLLFTLSVREVGASRTSVTVGSAPLFALAIAFVFLGEPVRVPLVAGAVAIVAGGVLLAAERDRPDHLRGRGLAYALAASVLFAVTRQHRACTPRAGEPGDGRRLDDARRVAGCARGDAGAPEAE